MPHERSKPMSIKSPRRRLDLVEVAGLVVLAAIIGGVVATKILKDRISVYAMYGQDGAQEIEPLERGYGPAKNTRNIEEWAIRDFFHDERGGVFVDIGANHFQSENNTYYLETSLGWSGIAVDAQSEFADGYRLHRPRTKFFASFISDVSGQQEDLYVPRDNSLVASSNARFTAHELSPESRLTTSKRSIETLSLNDLLDREHVRRVDFVSIDIELAEPKALAGFDIDRFQPRLVCIEAHRDVRQQILDYFARHRYVVLGKYLRADTANLYFAPVED